MEVVSPVDHKTMAVGVGCDSAGFGGDEHVDVHVVDLEEVLPLGSYAEKKA